MIHWMRGAGERLGCPSSLLLPGLRANFADDLAASACRLKLFSPVLPAGFTGTFAPGSPASTMLEARSLTGLRLGAAGRQLRFVHVEAAASAPGEHLILACGPGGERVAPGPFACLGERRRKTPTAVSDGLF
jgi:hypothetical protein